MRVTYKLTMLGAALVLVAAACSDDDASSEASAATTIASTSAMTTAPSTTTTAATSTTPTVLATPRPADITETYTIPAFGVGYSIDYPAGWFVRTQGTITFIAQTEEQLESRFDDPIPPNVALSVGFDSRTVTFLRTIGLTADDPTAQDLLEFNTRNFDWTVLRDMGEVEIFGTTAVVVRVTDPDGDVAIQYQGVLPDGIVPDAFPDGEKLIFLFGFSAPTEEEVDEFLPAWETMIESITAAE